MDKAAIFSAVTHHNAQSDTMPSSMLGSTDTSGKKLKLSRPQPSHTVLL